MKREGSTAVVTGPGWLAYVGPFAAFVLLTAAESWIVGRTQPELYPWVYGAKVAIVTLVAIVFRSAWRDLRPWPGAGALGLAVILGLAVAAVWVGLDGRYPALPLQEERVGFDPGILQDPGRMIFLAVRLYGLVLLVPLIEELFWRDFLVRWIAHPKFETVPIGRVTPLAAIVSAALFALAHPEWLPGFLAGLAWAWLVLRTRSVAACVVSHLVANLALGIYVLATGAWKFW